MSDQTPPLPDLDQPRATAGYRPQVFIGAMDAWFANRPIFTLSAVERMRRDPVVRFNLRILTYPLQRIRWTVKCESEEVKAFVDWQAKFIWKRYLVHYAKILNWYWGKYADRIFSLP
jgi:hypothetical protein